ncbi:YafY family protein [uncultured Alsobacter sp.]|uniref:helix-turn-helix transcriptional regulator n=1 Tax=uncultured Alsobacter sp. TaxID=1748258 RepID=UPI0025F412F7|nr:YafY family protein [uncultured Alsobacter sp.]
MSRAQRLLDLAAVLRRHRRPVPGHVLADELGISLRTLYRDIAALIGQGAPIDGEAGVGYVLKPGWLLPPVTFPEEELDALALGLQLVTRSADPRLARAALSALGRIEAVIPAGATRTLEDSGLMVPPAADRREPDLAVMRDAIRREHRLLIDYDDGKRRTQRIVWPVTLAFFEHVRVLAAWCELRQDFRHFRTDRMGSIELLPDRYPRRRRVLAQEWRKQAGIPDTVR